MTSVITGGCACGAVRYTLSGPARRHSLCFCASCRRAAGATPVGWAVFSDTDLTVTGAVAVFNSSGDVRREFCPACGTGLFYRSASQFPGEVDVQSGTFDDPDAVPPTMLIQTDDAPSWQDSIDALPRHARFPPETPE